jgi:hypothetical protein
MSLKEVIQAATGVPVKLQKLVFKKRGPLDDHRRLLHECDIIHGATLHLAVKTDGLSVGKGQIHLASPALAKAKKNLHAQFLNNVEEVHKGTRDSHSPATKESSRRDSESKKRTLKETVELMPQWQDCNDRATQMAGAGGAEQLIEAYGEVATFDYRFLPDNHIFDLADRVRQRVRRSAQSKK